MNNDHRTDKPDEPTIASIRERIQRQIDYEELTPDEDGIVGRYAVLLDDSFTVADILRLLYEIDSLKHGD